MQSTGRGPEQRRADEAPRDAVRSRMPDTGPEPPPVTAGASTDLLIKKPATFFLVLLFLVLGAVGLERSLRPWRAYTSEPGMGARWIWAEGAAESGRPVAFWLTRDLHWPAHTPLEGRLAVAADEGYELWLNGRRVGSRQAAVGRARIESDLYDVTHFLESGVNRLVVEVRSERGAGGLLASLRDGDGRPLLVTDEDWRVVRRFDRALLQGRTSAERSSGEAEGDEGLERATVWGHPPTGRWRIEAARSPRKLAEARPAAPAPALPVRFRHPAPGSEWTEIRPAPLRHLPALGPQSLVDFGDEVTGFLTLDLHRTPDAHRDGAPALLFLSLDRLPRPGLEDLRPDVVVLPLPGAPGWRDLHPRRFRYAAVIGAPPGSVLYAEPASEAEASAWPAPALRSFGRLGPRGVFGLRPARSYTPVEELVWGRHGGVEALDDAEDAATAD